MNGEGTVNAVPGDVALQLCAEIREENRRRWYTPSALFSRLWCWGCRTFTKGNREQMCGSVVACPQVVARYRRPAGPAD
ncbi:MAG: hypothetical protein MAG451_00057 [Anaerolineales bacterium]|nr:hypothetical protein [Anaerolineales bacterium]